MADSLNRKLSSILDDQPSSTDFLDFRSYVEALKELIVHSKTRTPLTLGIFGRWGVGKTTLMKMLENDLNNEGLTTIWFNAWQYSDEDELWAAFLQSMLNKIQRSLGAYQLPIFKTKLFLKRIRWNQVPQSLIIYLGKVILALLPALLVDPVSQQFTPATKPILEVGGNLATLGLSIWIVGKPLFELIQKNVSINISDFQKTSNYQEHIAFLDQFREHFSDIVQSLPIKGDKRLAVFIDDLDRCSPDRTIQILDAIKLFVDVEGCVYVLGVDVDVVQKATAIKYKDDLVAQREYMSKIIQIPFQLPPLTRNEMRIFLEQLTLDLPDPECRKVFVAGLVVNPREMKRTINIFFLLWNLASKRNELFGKITPVRLAKIVVIQQGHPELHKILQQRPYSLIELEKYFHDQEIEKLAIKVPVNSGNDEAKDQLLNLEKSTTELSPELLAFSTNEALKSMLLLYNWSNGSDKNLEKDEYRFSSLSVDEIAVYFTLTARTEAVKTTINTQSDQSSLIGKIIGGRYRVDSLVSVGGLSSVYKVFDERLQRVAALKLLIVADPAVKMPLRFAREIQILGELKHPNIVQLYDAGNENGRSYFTMQYIPGILLSQVIKNKVLTDYEIIDLLIPILDALHYIHSMGIIHRDIKSFNILIGNHGNVPILADFGLAKWRSNNEFRHQEPITEIGAVVGTPQYMSPEQFLEYELDHRSDLYSFGVTLYECITGSPPFVGTDPMEMMQNHVFNPVPSPRILKPEISSELEQVILKLLEKDRGARYQTAQEVKDDLISWRKG